MRPDSSSGCARHGPGRLLHSRGVGSTWAWVADAVGVEGRAHACHHREVGVGEHARHRARLVAAYAVLAGDGTALLDAELDDRGGQPLGALGLAWDGGVVQHERVEIAVAGVEDVGHAQPVLGREVADARQRRRAGCAG